MLETLTASAGSVPGCDSIRPFRQTPVARRQHGDIAGEFSDSAARADAIESARTATA